MGLGPEDARPHDQHEAQSDLQAEPAQDRPQTGLPGRLQSGVEGAVERDAAAELFATVAPSADFLRSFDWAQTPLGPVSGWDVTLRSAIRTVLPSEVPMLLWWGPELIQIYNAPYAAIVGNKHPSVGQRAADCWAEVWDSLGQLAESVLHSGVPMYAESLPLLLTRHGYEEETYWTFSYSPITDANDEIVGLLVATTDVTAGVVSRRRLSTLRGLGTLSASEVGSVAAMCEAAVEVIAQNRGSVPFAVTYLFDEASGKASLESHMGMRTAPSEHATIEASPALRRLATEPWVLFDLSDEPALMLVPEVGPLGPSVPEHGVLIPLRMIGQDRVIGALCLGINPYRQIDVDYSSFLTLIGARLATLLADAWAYESERRRAQELTELDSAKTRFLQNVSHEFRTPLTLLLNVVRELETDGSWDEQALDRLETLERAGLRLQRLVESLFQFAQAETGTLTPTPQPTELARTTAELAGMFRSAAESAGLDLVIEVPSQSEPVLIDREMWSQIVLNLLSNAVKFTDAGSVTVSLDQRADSAVLRVSDTGIGIPAAEQDSVFDRFHRVISSTSRAREGSGIGLSLVRELVSALGGAVELDSTDNEGSTFTVTVPTTVAAVAPVPVSDGAVSDGVASDGAAPDTAVSATAEVAAALVNVAITGHVATGVTQHSPTNALGVADGAEDEADGASPRRLLLVEDDPDMRAYLIRLLTDDGWTVYAAPDVIGALSAPIRPDLVLSDVMLPGTSGTEFVKLIRGDETLSRLPVILITARAGSEAAAEGLHAGADDYIVKPFDPVELLARVRVHHELSSLREFALSQAQNAAANLRVALSSNREIGAAIGILMATRQMTADDAFELLRGISQTSHRKLRDVAEEVTLTGVLPEQ